MTGGMNDRRDVEQDWNVAGPEGCKTGGMEDWRDAGKVDSGQGMMQIAEQWGCRTLGHRTGGILEGRTGWMLNRTDARQEGSRTGMMQDIRGAGQKERSRTEMLQDRRGSRTAGLWIRIRISFPSWIPIRIQYENPDLGGENLRN